MTNINIQDLSEYKEIFKKPQISTLLDLTWQKFQKFIEHIFSFAGYKTKDVSSLKWPHGSGFDLELYHPENNQILGFVEIRRYAPSNLMDFKDISAFIGTLTLAQKQVPSFMVTTSDFTSPAKQAAKEHGNVFLLNGEKLIRYITYIGNSRVMEQNLSHIPSTFISPINLWKAENIKLLDPSQTTVLTIGNNKGGVAKTTSAVNFGLNLASLGFRVLLVDFDSQTSLTHTLPGPSMKSDRSLLNHFTQNIPLNDIIRNTNFKNVWILPSHPDLKYIDSGGSAQPEDEIQFVSNIHSTSLQTPDGYPFNWIIFDTPPAQTRFTRAALAASHITIIPTLAETYGMIGIQPFITTCMAMKSLMGRNVEVAGIFITKWRNTSQSKKILDDSIAAIKLLKLHTFDTKIPFDDKIEKAHLDTINGKTRNIFGLKSTAAKAYSDLVKEILINGNFPLTLKQD